MRKGMSALLAVGGALLFGSRASASNTPRPASGNNGSNTPRTPTDYHRSARAYAAAKASMMRARWDNTRIHDALRFYAPTYLPGMPLAAVLCLGVSSQGPAENTGGSLGERGLFNVETRFINQWANDAETLQFLGRAYDPSVSAYAQDIEAQVFTGVRRYRLALESASAAIAEKLEPATPVDAWSAWCAVDAYSAGAGTLAALVNGTAAITAASARPSRPAALAAHVDAAAIASATSVDGVRMDRIAGAAWAVVRPLQRYLAGKTLAAAVEPSAASWFNLEEIPAATDERLSALAHGG